MSAYFDETLALSDADFKLLRDLIHRRTGLFYENGRQSLLNDKLAPLVVERGLGSYLDYYYYLNYDPAADSEWERLAEALAVNESYFWREPGQIQLAAQKLVPDLQRRYPERPIRIWHAGCAHGQEPYSMSMALLEAGRYLFGQVEIIATDFDPDALEKARRAEYNTRALRNLPPEWVERYFRKTGDERWQLVESLRKRINFEKLNLADEADLDKMRDFDLIFCRNVIIYFSDEVVERLAAHFHRALRPEGALFLGASESLLRLRTDFQLTQIEDVFVYRKG